MSFGSHAVASTIDRDIRRAAAAAPLLQRRCSCGNHAAGQTACGGCSSVTERWQRAAVRSSQNGAADDLARESINFNPSAPSPRPSPSRPATVTPTRTRVDEVTDLTTAGLQAGYLSGYGIVARMRVEPDRVTWDGGSVTETLSEVSNSCPATLTQPGPCHGNSTFVIGAASGSSGVIPQQPATRNRFFDFHTTRSRNLSFLHDASRNPGGLSACAAVCQQTYAYNGVPIGTHIVTRRFRKGTFNGANVTMIDVTKEDNPTGPGDFPTRPSRDDRAYASHESMAEDLA